MALNYPPGVTGNEPEIAGWPSCGTCGHEADDHGDGACYECGCQEYNPDPTGPDPDEERDRQLDREYDRRYEG